MGYSIDYDGGDSRHLVAFLNDLLAAGSEPWVIGVTFHDEVRLADQPDDVAGGTLTGDYLLLAVKAGKVRLRHFSDGATDDEESPPPPGPDITVSAGDINYVHVY